MQLDLLARLPPELVGDDTERARHGVRIALRRVPAALLPESPEDPLRSLEYAVVDVETTGGSPLRGHRITEFAAVRVRGTGEVVEEFSTLVNPLRPVPRFITALTGIDRGMLADAPRFEEVADRVRRVLAGAVFVAHNAGFDHRFVQL